MHMVIIVILYCIVNKVYVEGGKKTLSNKTGLLCIHYSTIVISDVKQATEFACCCPNVIVNVCIWL